MRWLSTAGGCCSCSNLGTGTVRHGCLLKAQEPARYAALQQGNRGGSLTGVGLEVASAPDGKGLLVNSAHTSYLRTLGDAVCCCRAHRLPAVGQRAQAPAP